MLLSEEKEKKIKLNLIFNAILENTSEDAMERKAHDIY